MTLTMTCRGVHVMMSRDEGEGGGATSSGSFGGQRAPPPYYTVAVLRADLVQRVFCFVV